MKQPAYRVESTLSMPKLKKIPLSAISPAPYLVRPVDAQELGRLTESVRRHGLLQPIGVRRRPGRPARYELLFGYRRLLACRALFLPEVSCLVFPDQRLAAVLSLCENFLRRDVPIRELTALAARLSLSTEELCARLPLPCPEAAEKTPKPRVFSLFEEEEAKPAPMAAAASGACRKGIVRDVRLVANSIERAVGAGKDAGFSIEVQKIERKSEIWYHIRLPRDATASASLIFSEELSKSA